MQLPPFTYVRPPDLATALADLAMGGADTSLLAGGTDLLVNMKLGLTRPSRLIAIGGLPELTGVSVSTDGSLRIGAGTLLTDLAEHPAITGTFPAVAAAIRSVGSRHVRNMATLGGNLHLPTRCWYTNQSENWREARVPCWKTEGLICHVIKTSTTCRALNSADSAPALIALGATVTLRSRAGEREVPLTDFYQDDGVNYTVLEPGEIITAVTLPFQAARSAFIKVAPRTGLDYGLATLAAAVTGSNRAVRSVMIVAGSVGSRPVVLAGAARIIAEQGLNERSITAAAAAVRDDLSEVTNLFSPPGYKKRLVRGLVSRVLGQVRAQKALAPGAPA